MNPTPKLVLKQSTGWFAAGWAFGDAMITLSDSAFKLFAWLCLNAERQTGRMRITTAEIAQALGKSEADMQAAREELLEHSNAASAMAGWRLRSRSRTATGPTRSSDANRGLASMWLRFESCFPCQHVCSAGSACRMSNWLVVYISGASHWPKWNEPSGWAVPAICDFGRQRRGARDDLELELFQGGDRRGRP
jgi:hypothetical protein